MKFSKYFMLAGATLLLAACSSEEPVNNGSENNGEPVGYIKVELGDITDGTRAAGNTDLNVDNTDAKITSATFYFYAKGGNTPLFHKEVKGDAWSSHTGNCAIVEVDNVNATEVAVIVNYAYTGSDPASAKLTGGGYKGADGYYMASAAYYDKNNSYATTYRTTINKLYATAQEAEADEGQSTKMYVERVVAKVNMTTSIEDYSSIDIADIMVGTSTSTKASVKFVPENVFLTNTNKATWLRKRLDPYTDFATDTWFQGKIVDAANNNRSHWTQGCIDATTKLADIDQYSYNDQAESVTLWTAEKPAVTEYVYDHVGSTQERCTSIILVGKYNITGTGLNINADGDFWIVASGGKFHVFDTESKAIVYMSTDGKATYNDGGTTKNRTLVKVSDEQPWLFKLNDNSSPVTCMIFKNGLGYYSAPITHFTNATTGDKYFGVVRNHIYNVDVNSIAGLGIGIPDPDDPIIPVDPLDPANEKAFFHVSVNVLPWDIIKQDVKW
ncbi:MAG: fimbria major subunit [Muribaculaceae bacterium]|nr:fimbria major subunit [Muribaculaceae bacterium]